MILNLDMISILKRIFDNKPEVIEIVHHYFCCGDDLLSVYIDEILNLIKYRRWEVIKNMCVNPQKKVYVYKIINYCKRIKI
jgi:hypothetical protein